MTASLATTLSLKQLYTSMTRLKSVVEVGILYFLDIEWNNIHSIDPSSIQTSTKAAVHHSPSNNIYIGTETHGQPGHKTSTKACRLTTCIFYVAAVPQSTRTNHITPYHTYYHQVSIRKTAVSPLLPSHRRQRLALLSFRPADDDDDDDDDDEVHRRPLVIAGSHISVSSSYVLADDEQDGPTNFSHEGMHEGGTLHTCIVGAAPSSCSRDAKTNHQYAEKGSIVFSISFIYSFPRPIGITQAKREETPCRASLNQSSTTHKFYTQTPM